MLKNERKKKIEFRKDLQKKVVAELDFDVLRKQRTFVKSFKRQIQNGLTFFSKGIERQDRKFPEQAINKKERRA